MNYQRLHFPKNLWKLYLHMNQTNKRLMKREKASVDTPKAIVPDARLYLMPPTAHPKAPKAKDPRRDPRAKIAGGDANTKIRDHNNQNNGGPIGSMTLTVIQ